MQHKILWLITARSGSKGIKNKNIIRLANKPLLAHRIISAKKVKVDSKIWISTDSKKYAAIAQQYGAEAPFFRPKKLSNDKASSIEVALHAIEWGEKNNIFFNYLGILEPTSPFVLADHLKDALKILDKNPAATGIVATKKITPNTFLTQKNSKYLTVLAKRLKLLQDTRRQAFVEEITPSGGFYIAKVSSLKRQKAFYTKKTLSYKLTEPFNLEIDNKMDLLWAKFVTAKKMKKSIL